MTLLLLLFILQNDDDALRKEMAERRQKLLDQRVEDSSRLLKDAIPAATDDAKKKRDKALEAFAPVLRRQRDELLDEYTRALKAYDSAALKSVKEAEGLKKAPAVRLVPFDAPSARLLKDATVVDLYFVPSVVRILIDPATPAIVEMPRATALDVVRDHLTPIKTGEDAIEAAALLAALQWTTLDVKHLTAKTEKDVITVSGRWDEPIMGARHDEGMATMTCSLVVKEGRVESYSLKRE